MAYAIQLAEAEAQRGKTEMKTKMAPTLGDEVVSEVFKRLDILQLLSLLNRLRNLHRHLKALVQHHPHRLVHKGQGYAEIPWTIKGTACKAFIAESCSETCGRMGENSNSTSMEESPPWAVNQLLRSVKMITGLQDVYRLCEQMIRKRPNWVDTERGTRLIRLGSRLLIFPICTRFCIVHVNSLVSIINLW